MAISSNEVFCFVAHDAIMEAHAFQCYKIIISVKGTYTTILNGTKLQHISGHVLSSNVNHVCLAPDTSVLVYLIEIESRVGLAVRQLLNEQPFLDLSPLLATDPFTGLLDQGLNTLPENNLSTLANEVLLALLPSLNTLPTPVRDQRVTDMLYYINDHIQDSLVLSQVADRVHLSSDRARHLFEQQVGSTFSKFVLWKRVKGVLYAVVKEDMNLSHAIHQYGFFDHTHFGRNFKRMFGVSPSIFLNKNAYIHLL